MLKEIVGKNAWSRDATARTKRRVRIIIEIMWKEQHFSKVTTNTATVKQI